MATRGSQGSKYTAVSVGFYASYFLREDGAVDRSKSGGKIDGALNPPPGVKYIQASAGNYATYLVQDDGVIARSKGSGKISGTMEDNKPYASVSVQIAAQESQYGSRCNQNNYLIRAEGSVDKTKHFGAISGTIAPPPGLTYTAACAGEHASYLLRSDGYSRLGPDLANCS